MEEALSAPLVSSATGAGGGVVSAVSWSAVPVVMPFVGDATATSVAVALLVPGCIYEEAAKV